MTRSRMAGSTLISGQGLRDVDRDAARGRVQVVQRAGHDLVQADRPREQGQRAGLQPAHVQQVVHQVGEPVQRLVRRGQQLVVVLGRPVHVPGPQAGHRGLRGRQRRAQVVAHGGQQRGPHLVGGRDRLGRLGLRGQPLLVEGDRRVGRERAEHAAVRGGQRPALQRERQAVGDRHLDVGLVRPGDGGRALAGHHVPGARRAAEPLGRGVRGLAAVGGPRTRAASPSPCRTLPGSGPAAR